MCSQLHDSNAFLCGWLPPLYQLLVPSRACTVAMHHRGYLELDSVLSFVGGTLYIVLHRLSYVVEGISAMYQVYPGFSRFLEIDPSSTKERSIALELRHAHVQCFMSNVASHNNPLPFDHFLHSSFLHTCTPHIVLKW